MKNQKTIPISHTGTGSDVRIPADTPLEDQAGVAAAILARRMYGPRGEVATLRLDSSAGDGSGATYEAFVGVPPTALERRRYAAGGISGRNVWIYV